MDEEITEKMPEWWKVLKKFVKKETSKKKAEGYRITGVVKRPQGSTRKG